MEEYDELKAIAYIRGKIGAEASALYDDDELLNVIDIIFDWYDDNGFLDIDVEEDDEVDVEGLTDYVKRMLAKDKLSPIKPEDVPAIIAAELEYERLIDESLA